MHDAPGVAADYVPGAGGHHDLGARQARGADAAYHYSQVLDLPGGDLEGVNERRQDHDRRAVLVVVEDRDLELVLQSFLDLEAPRRGDVLEVYAPERRGYVLYRPHDLVRVLGVEADWEGIHAGELLEERGLALHDRHRGLGPYVPEPQNRRTVGDDRHGVAFDGEVERALGVL